jgi:hypothetical protein
VPNKEKLAKIQEKVNALKAKNEEILKNTTRKGELF